MARLKIRMELNPGGTGVRFHKLAKAAEEFEKLFRYLAQDLGVNSNNDDWLARNFTNGSVGYDVELQRSVEQAVIPVYNHYVEALASFREDNPPPARLSPRTLKQFVAAGKILDSDERIKLGLYKNGGAPDWRYLAKAPSLDLERYLETPIRYVGTVQGKTHTWYKESDYFDLRDVLFGETVKCYYPKALYSKIADAFKDREAVVHVHGQISSNRMEKRPFEVRVTDVAVFAKLSDEEFKRFYGIAPNLTGDESTEEYIARIRDDGDA